MDSFVDRSTGATWATLPATRGEPPVGDAYWHLATDQQVQALFTEYGLPLLDAWGRLDSTGSTFYTTGGTGHLHWWADGTWSFALNTGEVTSIAMVAPAFVHAVPEPAASVMLALGLCALLLWRKLMM